MFNHNFEIFQRFESSATQTQRTKKKESKKNPKISLVCWSTWHDNLNCIDLKTVGDHLSWAVNYNENEFFFTHENKNIRNE